MNRRSEQTSEERRELRRATEGASRGPTFYRRFGKRAFDLAGATIGLVVAMPLFVVCATWVRFGSPGPVFFRQKRIGQGGKSFTILKFRTMFHYPSGSGLRITADGDQRVTKEGKWLRKFKLDELPQLLNVLIGDMSLVGPRPEVAEYVAVYRGDQLRTLEFKPGLTCVASLAHLDEERMLAEQPEKEAFYLNVLLPQKLASDLTYCADLSFLVDVRLCFATLEKILWLLLRPSPTPPHTLGLSRENVQRTSSTHP